MGRSRDPRILKEAMVKRLTKHNEIIHEFIHGIREKCAVVARTNPEKHWHVISNYIQVDGTSEISSDEPILKNTA